MATQNVPFGSNVTYSRIRLHARGNRVVAIATVNYTDDDGRRKQTTRSVTGDSGEDAKNELRAIVEYGLGAKKTWEHAHWEDQMRARGHHIT